MEDRAGLGGGLLSLWWESTEPAWRQVFLSAGHLARRAAGRLLYRCGGPLSRGEDG